MQQLIDLQQTHNAAPNYKIIIFEKHLRDIHRGRINAPQINECAILLANENHGKETRDVAIYNLDHSIQQVSELSSLYDSFGYILMHMAGELGWTYDNSSENEASLLAYYRYRLHFRESGERIGDDKLFYFQLLFQQYICDMAAKYEATRMTYYRNNQKQLRVESYSSLMDHFAEAKKTGKVITVLPSSHVGSPRYLHNIYLNCMAVAMQTSHPCYFITVRHLLTLLVYKPTVLNR